MLQGCTKERTAEPMCRTSEAETPAPAAAAACIIRLDNKLIAIASADSGWQLPTEKSQANQSAQCTAHQAVWQSTGLNVEVAQKLGETSNNMQIYNCLLTSGFDSQTQSLPVPTWAQHKITKIEIINPFETTHAQWSDNIELIEIRTWFNKIN